MYRDIHIFPLLIYAIKIRYKTSCRNIINKIVIHTQKTHTYNNAQIKNYNIVILFLFFYITLPIF